MKSFAVLLWAGLVLVAGPLAAQDTPVPRVSSEATQSQAPGDTAPPIPLDPQVEVAFWESIKDSDDPMLYLAYLEQFPEGAFRVIARNRLDDLWDKAVRAFALLEQLGVSVDTPPGAGVTAPPAQAPAPTPPPVVVAPAPTPPAVIVRPASPTPNPPSARLIRNTQNQLRKHGCYKGVVDGIWGGGSKAAMRRFNRRGGTSFKTARPTREAIAHMRELTKLKIKICR